MTRPPKNKITVLTVLILFFIVTASLSAFSVVYGYDRGCALIAGLFHKEHQLAAFKQNYLTSFRYVQCQYLLSAMSVLLVFLYWYTTKKYSRIAQWVGELIAETRLLAKDPGQKMNDRTEQVCLIVLLLSFFAWSLYNIITYPISYDEAWTYINFSRHPLLAAFYYPAANNHIFFSLLTNISSLLHIDQKIEIRLITLFFGIVSVYFLYRLLRRYFSFSSTIVSASVFAFSYPVALYTMLARGYIVQLFLFLVSLYCLLFIVENTPKKIHWVLFVLVNILAFYTLPSYLYAFATQLVFAGILLLRNRNYEQLKSLFISCAFIVIFVVLLYTPVLLLNGIDSIVSNINTKPLSAAEVIRGMPAHLSSTSDWLFGTDSYGIYLILVIIACNLLFYFSKDNRKDLALFSLLCILLPVLFIYLHKVLPFQRTWIHLTVAVSISIAWIIEIVTKQFPKIPSGILSPGIAFILAATLAFHFHLEHPGYHNNYTIDKKAGLFVNATDFDNVHSIYNHTWNFTSDCFETFIVYKQQQYTETVFQIERKRLDPSKRYELLILSDKDTVENNYLAGYNLLYVDSKVKLYMIKP